MQLMMYLHSREPLCSSGVGNSVGEVGNCFVIFSSLEGCDTLVMSPLLAKPPSLPDSSLYLLVNVWAQLPPHISVLV